MKSRYETHALADRPKVAYEYYVSGTWGFPVDMLRYDCCWPADGFAAQAMADLIEVRRSPTVVSIKMRSYREPTVDRWLSFGWSVGTEDLK